ncbi:hypothetical protein [Oceaniovalibus sp. ACAM 378]|uniref:hypothetical protein n=1 Tax=Oceaniovalibus sp. ACAM 378 TaxID=2599923 RepID=UPI0011D4EA8C|nr:hypothetical protein [Oceaniovalibus sp. ACAM 378]TYB90338.1 hypothetical protein FQ320_05790 [Oceaniovalibus sp. ACAM 378]
MQLLEDLADELAVEALAAANSSGDEKIVDQVGEVLGASSQTLQEAYLTAVRVRRAETRARALLAPFQVAANKENR